MKQYIIARNNLNRRKKISVSKLKFRPSVYGLLFKDNKILLCPNWDGYDFPGGGMNIDETLEETLKREFWEETGLRIEAGKLITCAQGFFHGRIEPILYWNSIFMYYLVRNPRGKITDKYFDQHEKTYAGLAEWIPTRQALKLKFYNGVDSPALIKKALKLKNK